MPKKKDNYITKEYFEERTVEQTSVLLSAIDKLHTSISENKESINGIQTLIDGYVKAQEDFKQEFVIMKEEVKQIKEVLKKKFKIEIKAI